MDYNRFDVPKFCDSQSMKDCKKTTPDFVMENKSKGVEQVGFQTKDVVLLDNVISLVGKSLLDGEFIFDSYDKYDNTCYVYNTSSSLTYNVLLTDIKYLRKNK